MGDARITIDSHALIWYVDEDLKRNLSASALEAIREAEKNGVIYVPTIALLEIYRLIEKGRIKLSFNKLLSDIERGRNYQVIPFDIELLRLAVSIKGLELHDKLIFATAMLTNSALVSKDRVIKAKTSNVKVIW
jgi:PIN domain nuclease of toxin-antitoxin system